MRLHLALALLIAGCHASSPKCGKSCDERGGGDAGITELDLGDGVDLAQSQPTSCDGVTCNTPPQKSCHDAETLRIYDALGTCSDGQCAYASRTEPCAAGCVNGACVGNPCQGVTCNLPPPKRCLDGSTLVVPSATGSCAGGSCRYGEGFATCPYGCEAGACVNDPCIGVTCNQPPANFCISSTTLRSFQTAGACSGGGCLYTPTDETCPFGCVAGACANDPCAGKLCNMPPANACVGAYTLRSFAAIGACSGGGCLYPSSDIPCQYGCVDGACAGDPCAGVSCNTPPAASCLDATTRRSYATPGSCAGGGCNYLAQESTCVYGCAAGACKGDPCQGVSCDTPPAAACVSPSTLRSFSPSGTCNGGACNYPATDTLCEFGCGSGHCLPDPCASVTCNSPPARACVSGASRVYSPTGTCSGGSCSYVFTDTPCANGCGAGFCNPPSCGGVTCIAPPATTCTNATRLQTWFPVGSCAADSCGYTSYSVDCSLGCINGACIAGSWTLESTPFGSSLENGNGVLDGDGEPVLAGCTGGQVRVRRRTIQGWKEEVVDSGMGSCEARVVLDASGEPMVAYTDAVNDDLRFARRNGGSWNPKELVANAGEVGYGLSLAITAEGVPLASYRGPDGIRLATRAADGSWSEETIPSVEGYSTELRLDGGKPVVFVAASYEAWVATKDGSWSAISTPVGQVSLEVLRQSFTAGSAPAILLKGSNPMSGSTDWSYRIIDGDGAQMRDESLGGDTPLALRSDGPPAIYAKRPTPGGSTASLIRVRKNGAWEQLVNPVPWGNQLSTPMMYTGGTRHVLVDTYARRLLSPAGCAPMCDGRSCGDDGCGGSCGSCGAATSCAPTGVCSSLAQATLPGFAPSRAALGSGAVAHAVETSSSAYIAQQYRSTSAGAWQPAAQLGPITVALGSTRVVVDSAGVPRVVLNGTIGQQTGAHLATRQSDGSWTTEPISTSQSGQLAIDASDKLYFVQCGTSSVSLRTKTAAGAWSAASTVYSRPSGYTSMSCGYLAVSKTGVIAIPVSREFWVGNPIYDYRYDRGILTNESGSFELISLGSNLTTYTTGEVLFDPAGAMHALVGADYRVRAPGGSFASETLPAGFAAGTKRVLEIDNMGALVVAWISGSGATQLVNLSKRTGPGTWSTDSAPTLSSVNSGITITPTLHGLAFDGAGKAHLLLNEGDTYRALIK